MGESPSNCSFHLRQLAKYGFVEEAEGGGGRRRRVVNVGIALVTSRRTRRPRWRPAPSPAWSRSAGSRARVGMEQRQYLPEEWRAVTGSDQMTLYVTPEEMKAINDQLVELLLSYRERIADPSKRPEGSRPIEHIAVYYPVDPRCGGCWHGGRSGCTWPARCCRCSATARCGWRSASGPSS